ncbi:MAG: hypothetical protein JW836_09885 [Deltaproteobacteria bacterium]|nr:hypothetical protein [Deltaproteobacteria bacterium]
MPRKSRIDIAGALHHVMVKGIERGKRGCADLHGNETPFDRLGILWDVC